MTLTTVEDEYSRAMLGKRPGKGSGQSVLDQKFDFRFLLIAFFLIVCLAVKDEEHFEKVACGIQKADVACENCRQILSNEIRLLEVRGAVPLRFLSRQSCWGYVIACRNFFPYLRTSETYCTSFFSSSFLRMSGPSDRRLDLNVVEENDMTAAVVAKNLLTLKDNRLLSKQSDELAVKDSLAFNVQCASSVHLLPSSSGAVPHTETPNDQPLVPPLSGVLPSTKALNNHPPIECSLVERDSGIALHHLQMSESGSPSDEGSPSSSSRFELAMLESSGPLLESCTKETLDDFRNCQTLANIGSSSFMSVGEGVVFDAIPIFRSEFTTDLLEKNLLDSERQLEALRQLCSIPRSVGMQLPSEPSKCHVMFYTQILLTLRVKLPLHPWLQRMLSFIGYAPGQLNPGFWDTLIRFYIIWMECGLGEPLFHQWCYCYKMRPMKACPGYAECELADVKKVLRVPKEDRHLGKLRPLFRNCILYFDFSCLVEKVSKKGGISTKKGKTPMLVPVDDILFHMGAHKHRVRPAPRPKLQEKVLKITTSKRAEAEAIRCAAAILIFAPIMKFTDQECDLSSSHKRKYKEEVGSIHWKDLKVAMQLGEPLDENESDRDWMMRLSSYVMTEYDNRLREVERYKAKFKENNQLVNDARKTSKALNVRLKKQLEGTKKQLETTILEVSKVKGELDNALVEVSELKKSIPTERDATVQEFLGSQAFQDAFKPHCIRAANFEKRKWIAYRDEMDKYRQRGEAFVLAVDPSNEDDSDNKASVGEQSQESEDGSGDIEDGGDGDAVKTQSDIVRGSTSYEDDSYFKPEHFSDRDVKELRPSCLNHLFIELMPNGLHYIGCRMAVAQRLYSVSLLVIVLQVISVPWMTKGLAIGAPQFFWTRNVACSSSSGTTASVPKASENGISPVEVRYEVRNGCQGFYFDPLCEVVNCNDCIADLALSRMHWAYQIKSPLGEGPMADHMSKRLERGLMNSCVAIIFAFACVRHRKYGRLKPRL
ncbi:GRIP domain-containing protein RUD3-like [Pyrus ussuriensis x Pyrus communis]|uniref:GRIP domain-containing protein RUD3-like n=1 Tax=Pyrus ussuriensis x Pyrus communis TaxID=2448454 RepID=A0A5N5HXL0_9ROSA|nr:GRIP domain-containing protein RUD3-like [Pyrus ussuriensis x Pyrus communis]